LLQSKLEGCDGSKIFKKIFSSGTIHRFHHTPHTTNCVQLHSVESVKLHFRMKVHRMYFRVRLSYIT